MSANDALDTDRDGLLSDATLLALGLHHQPFSSQLRDASAPAHNDSDTAPQPFSDAVTEEQLADIKQALITGDDLLLILGEKGSGKTTLTQQLDAHSGLRIQCFCVTGSEKFSTLNLFAGMLEAFQRNPPQKLKDVLDELTPCLQSMAARNTLSVIVLDDAHKASQNELTQLLSGMLYMNSQDETLMRVALAAKTDFEDIIPDLLPEGADMPYSSLTIEGMSPQRAAAYLDYRLTLAGFDQEFPFTERDMASLVDHSDGRPEELHALTADVLNEKYGRLETELPHELLSPKEQGFLSSRKSKLALGALATVLILVGLLTFLPQGDKQNRSLPDNALDVAEQTVATPEQAPELKLIDTEQPGSASDTPSSSTQQTLAQNTVSASDSSPVEPTSQVADNTQDGLETGNSDSAGNSATQSEQPDSSASENAASAAATDTPESAAETQTNTSESAQSNTSDDTPLVITAENAVDEPVTDTTEPAGQSETAEPLADNQNSGSVDDVTAAADTQTTAPQTVASVDAELTGLLESPTWILVQDESQFTIQMSASRDLPSVENFLRRNTLPGPNSIFSFEREGEVWFALVHGIFPTFADAQQAVEAMPASAQRDTPWIRSIARVKEILRQE